MARKLSRKISIACSRHLLILTVVLDGLYPVFTRQVYFKCKLDKLSQAMDQFFKSLEGVKNVNIKSNKISR